MFQVELLIGLHRIARPSRGQGRRGLVRAGGLGRCRRARKAVGPKPYSVRSVRVSEASEKSRDALPNRVDAAMRQLAASNRNK